MRRTRFLIPIFIVIVSAIAIIFLFHGKVMMHPKGFLMLDNADGLKNYFTFAYYLKHDTGLLFTGFDYPYGEHIIYTDNHPIAALFFNFIDDHLFPIADHAVGMLNLWMFLSMSLGTLFIYLVLKELGVGRWFAVPMALLITFLSPQLDRTFAHYSLSYIYFIPMYWYGFLQFNKRQKMLRWGVFIGVVLFIAGLTHTYLMLIGVLFFLSYVGVYTLSALFSKSNGFQKQNRLAQFKYIGSILLFALTPLLIIQTFISVTDPYDGRIEVPYGFFTFNAFFEQTFFPVYPPFRQLFIYIFRGREAVYGEAMPSVGTIGFILLVLTGIRMLTFLIKKRPIRIFRITTNRELNLSLWAATLVLLFSFGYPFIWGLEWLLDYLPKLRQFRALARFAWIFYYVFLIYGAYYWYLIYRRLRFKKLQGIAFSIIGLVLLVWGIEAHVNLWYTSGESPHRRTPYVNRFLNELPPHIDSLQQAVDLSQYQAAMIFPYFNCGSEKFIILRDSRAMQWGMSLAYHTGLPLMNNFSTRSPIQHTTKVVQLLSSPLIKKDILPVLKDKPILLCEYQLGKYSADEARLTAQADLIFETEEWKYYHLTKKDFNTQFDSIRTQYERQKDSLSTVFSIKRDFDTLNSPISLRGKGALYTTDNALTIFDEVIPQDSTTLEFSFWLHINTRMAHPSLVYERFDSAGTSLQKEQWSMWDETEVYKDWLRVQRPILAKNGDRHQFKLINANPITVDELLIRPIKTPVFEEKEGALLYNGYLIEED